MGREKGPFGCTPSDTVKRHTCATRVSCASHPLHLAVRFSSEAMHSERRADAARDRGDAMTEPEHVPSTSNEDAIARLAALLGEGRCVVLTGAGCSTESGIPDYRGAGRPARPSSPIQHGAFLRDPMVRRRYWARATWGWERCSRARPNRAHRALAALEKAGAVAGVITQNVDRLHHAAGSVRVVELHGALADVICLDCGEREARADLQTRLLSANPGWLDGAAATNPDGDADLPAERVAHFRLVACRACAGTLKPEVVFFGGSVPAPVLASAWKLFSEATMLLVVGSSLAVFSGFRFARRASELGLPMAVVNLGPTRADPLAPCARVYGPAGPVLALVAERMRVRVD
jgi:NAD-dependent protein deacetylase/lipoamidase sirtuin 4